MGLLNTLGFILRHPLNRGRRGAALVRWLRWSECPRSQDAKRDIRVPLSPCARRQPLPPGSPRSGTMPIRYAGRPPAPTLTGDYRPLLSMASRGR